VWCQYDNEMNTRNSASNASEHGAEVENQSLEEAIYVGLVDSMTYDVLLGNDIFSVKGLT
jgi:hypothetical protein